MTRLENGGVALVTNPVLAAPALRSITHDVASAQPTLRHPERRSSARRVARIDNHLHWFVWLFWCKHCHRCPGSGTVLSHRHFQSRSAFSDPLSGHRVGRRGGRPPVLLARRRRTTNLFSPPPLCPLISMITISLSCNTHSFFTSNIRPRDNSVMVEFPKLLVPALFKLNHGPGRLFSFRLAFFTMFRPVATSRGTSGTSAS